MQSFSSKRNQDTFGRDVEEMIAAKLTFNEAINCWRNYRSWRNNNLKIVQRDLFEQLDRVPFWRWMGLQTIIDLKRLAAEVSVQHGIRVDPDDPMMAVVTLNRLVFEQAVGQVLERVQASVKDFEIAADKVQIRAGDALAQEVPGCGLAMKQEVEALEGSHKGCFRTPPCDRSMAGVVRPPPLKMARRWPRARYGSVLSWFLDGCSIRLDSTDFGDNQNNANVSILARGLGSEGKARFPSRMRIASLRCLQVTVRRFESRQTAVPDTLNALTSGWRSRCFRPSVAKSGNDAFPCVQLTPVGAPAFVYLISAMKQDCDFSFGRIVLKTGKRKNLIAHDLVYCNGEAFPSRSRTHLSSVPSGFRLRIACSDVAGGFNSSCTIGTTNRRARLSRSMRCAFLGGI